MSQNPSFQDARCSLLNELSHHISAIGEIRLRGGDSFESQLAENGLKIMESLIHSTGVNGDLISSVRQLCHDNMEGAAGGKLALLHFGRALHTIAMAENTSITVNAGFTPDNFGHPVIPIAPPLEFSDEETTERMENEQSESSMVLPVRVARVKNEVYWGEGHPIPLLYENVGNPIPMVVKEEKETIPMNNCPLNLTTAYEVDCSNLPPVKPERRFIADVKELNLSGENKPRRKSLSAPMKPFELKYDGDGSLLVKSEMLGDDEFFDHQIKQREIGVRYEEIAKTGKYEESEIMKYVGTGNGKKQYECKCGMIYWNQGKYASHIRFAHPKTDAERKSEVKKKAEKSEEKILKETNQVELVENEKRRTRSTLGRPSEVTSTPVTSTPTPSNSSNKIYTCPLCFASYPSAALYGSHIRYSHPKNSSSKNSGVIKALIGKKEEEPTNSTMDAPVKALNTSSTTLSNIYPSGKRKPKMEEYICRLCGKWFEHPNGVAEHTRQCIKANGASNSSRSLSREVIHIKKELIPQSPLIDGSTSSSETKTTVQNPKEGAGAHDIVPRPIKIEPEDEEESLAVTSVEKVVLSIKEQHDKMDAAVAGAVGAVVTKRSVRLSMRNERSAAAAAGAATTDGSEVKNEEKEKGKEDSKNEEKMDGKRIERKQTRAEMNAHRGLHSKFARPCFYCGMECTTIHATDRHVKNKHPGARDEIYSCCHCKKSFLTIGGLDDHWSKAKDCEDGLLTVNGVVFDVEKEKKKKGNVEIKGEEEEEDDEGREKDQKSLPDSSSDSPPFSSTSIRLASTRKRKAKEIFDYDPRNGK